MRLVQGIGILLFELLLGVLLFGGILALLAGAWGPLLLAFASLFFICWLAIRR